MERLIRSDIVRSSVTQEHSDSQRVSAFIPEIIVSGLQTGADLGGLEGARLCGIPTGGYAPKGFKTESGPRPDLGALYNLTESESSAYDVRTGQNVAICDAILLVAGNFNSTGTKLTKRLGEHLPIFEVAYPKLPSLENPYPIMDIRLWLHYHKPVVLFVAGNRESVCPGIQRWTTDLMRKIFVDN